MTTERLASDVRDLRRVIEGLKKSVDDLNKTLVAIENNRQAEKLPEPFAQESICPLCMGSRCTLGGIKMDDTCRCCNSSHERTVALYGPPIGP